MPTAFAEKIDKFMGGLQKVSRELLLMAHHMVFFCGFHFKHEKAIKFLLKYYAPQTDARHTVNARCLLTLPQLRQLLTVFPYFTGNKGMLKLVSDATQFRGTLDNELQDDRLLTGFS